MSVDFVKVRDVAAMILDAANEQLEKMVPVETKYDEDDFDPLTSARDLFQEAKQSRRW